MLDNILGSPPPPPPPDIPALEDRHNIHFLEYFHEDLLRLCDLAIDGLVETSETKITATSRGRLLAAEECFTLAREISHIELEPDAKWLASVGKRDILMRMLRNIGAAYSSRGLTSKAIDVLSLLIRANPDSAEEYRQRGVLGPGA